MLLSCDCVHPNIMAKAMPAMPRKGANFGVKSCSDIVAEYCEVQDDERRRLRAFLSCSVVAVVDSAISRFTCLKSNITQP